VPDHDSSLYGERIAEIYDTLHPLPPDADAAAAYLADLAGGGRALELGIGTGRVAIPLAERGVEVHGIDASPAMLERLAAKPGAASLDVRLGDFTDLSSEGTFDLIYVVLSTFFMLPTQEAQVRCFLEVARHLNPGGAFVVQVFQSGLDELLEHGVLRVSVVTDERVTLEAGRHDPLEQTVVMQRIVISEDRIRLCPITLRYARPPELDLMARCAGLRRRSRAGDWDGRVFAVSSPWNLTVYERPPRHTDAPLEGSLSGVLDQDATVDSGSLEDGR
jgi:SAM-dependent methyltransferase